MLLRPEKPCNVNATMESIELLEGEAKDSERTPFNKALDEDIRIGVLPLANVIILRRSVREFEVPLACVP
eukprot:4788120-Amphidinium_carterae.1